MSTKSPSSSAWFWIAVQALVVIAETDGACPSGTIAHELNAHAVFLRRVMAQLVRAGILEAREGRDGGYRLIHTPEQIRLSEVYQATKVSSTEEHKCTPALNISVQIVQARVKQELENSTVEVLGHYTIASFIEHEDDISQDKLFF